MATILQPQLFLAVAQTQGGAATSNNWEDLNNVLAEDVNDAWTEWSVSDLRNSWTMNLSQPDFPAYPPEETPVWMRLTLNIDPHISASSGTIRSTFIQMGPNGIVREFPGMTDGPQTRYYSGTVNEWGVTRDEAADVINGVSDVRLYFSSDDPDSIMRILWAKLEAKLEAPQTEVLTPPITF